jgi:ankyrin repeat protein
MIHNACVVHYQGLSENVIELIRKGADPLLKNVEGQYAHTLAATRGHQQLSMYIAEYGLTRSVLFGTTEDVMTMVRHGASVNMVNAEGWTPLLHVCAKSSDASLVK